ncbi:hypothetical protein, conserved [Leishmania lindenbergi]|uniref:GIPL galf transferase n=1 Tax=Leishmania lindenbergi TaxID=651832 RepID=A0AAW3A275_9TRYP
MAKNAAAQAMWSRRPFVTYGTRSLFLTSLLFFMALGAVLLFAFSEPMITLLATPNAELPSDKVSTEVTQMTNSGSNSSLLHTTPIPYSTAELSTLWPEPTSTNGAGEDSLPREGETIKPAMHNDSPEMNPWKKMRLPTDWTVCIRRNLQLDDHGRPLYAAEAMEDAIPLLITPLTGDVEFFPFFVCSIDVPVRYHYVIQNERNSETTAVIDRLQRLFGESGRLLIVRSWYNRGYSGSMNQGFEWALKERTEEEVPWVFACGVDVIFERGLLATMVQVVQNNTRGDAAMLAALRAEVELEERLVREGNYSYYERWVPRGRPLKVLRSGYPGVPLNVRTAPLMPDRIRYMVGDENRRSGIVTDAELKGRFFGNYVATVTPVPFALGTIAVTRLALSAVGYFDENYFPAYMDDIDWRWRQFAYGFKTLYAQLNGPVIRWHHYNAANLRGSPFQDEYLKKYDTEANNSRVAFLQYIARSKRQYDKLKFGPRDLTGVWYESVQEGEYNYTYFNISRYPADTWVLDESARQCMFRHTYSYETQSWQRPKNCAYMPRTLEESGILGVDQVEAYKMMVNKSKFEYR